VKGCTGKRALTPAKLAESQSPLMAISTVDWVCRPQTTARVALCVHVAAVDQDGEGEAAGAGQGRLRACCAAERWLQDDL